MQMNRANKSLSEGVVLIVAGLALWLFTGDIHTPVITLTKVGAVVTVVGALYILHGSYVYATTWRQGRGSGGGGGYGDAGR
jgi:hypothetical protein